MKIAHDLPTTNSPPSCLNVSATTVPRHLGGERQRTTRRVGSPLEELVARDRAEHASR